MRELSHAGNDVVQGLYHFLMLDPFLDHDEDGVITSNGTNDFWNIAAVNVPGNGTGIAGRVLMTPMLPEKLMLINPGTCIISLMLLGVEMRLYIVSLGNT